MSISKLVLRALFVSVAMHLQGVVCPAVADGAAPQANYATLVAASACAGHTRIAVGGVTGLASLGDPNASAQLRQTCDVGLYIHAEGWKLLDDGTKAAILTAFSGTGPAVVELGYVSTPAGYFKNFYKPVFTDKGVHADAALINGLCQDGLDKAKEYINVARQYGLKTVAVVFAPNSGQFRTTAFGDPRWDCVRQAALYGGALAIDGPPHVYFGLKEGYQAFIIDEIRWANTNHVLSYYLVSANGSGDRFGAETASLLDSLKTAHAFPTNFVFEAYDVHRSDPANRVGTEKDAVSVLGVARQILPKILH